LTYEIFSQKYNIVENFLTFNGILQSIPKEWTKILQTNEATDTVQRQINHLKMVKKVPKFIYNEMIQYKIEHPQKCLSKWNKMLNINITLNEWYKYFQYIYKMTDCVKYQYFQFRLLHNTLITNEKLFKWKMVETDLCIFCEEEIEDLKHIFLDCEVIKMFWQKLNIWMKRKLQLSVNFNTTEILFGSLSEPLLIVDIIYLIAREYIYNCKQGEHFPNIHTLEKKIYQIQNIERDIAIKKGNFNQFIIKWGKL